MRLTTRRFHSQPHARREWVSVEKKPEDGMLAPLVVVITVAGDDGDGGGDGVVLVVA